MVKNGSHSALELTVSAGLSCIEKAGLTKGDIDLLINIGIYHDDNIMEPAIAPLIQQRLGINPDPVYENTNFTFCFDLYNGACGFINAVFVADSLLKTGVAKNILIVSSDVHPSKKETEAFPFTSLGSAVILSYDPDPSKGFSHFHFETSDNNRNGFLAGGNPSVLGDKGRHSVFFFNNETYADDVSAFAVASAKNYVASQNINLSKISHLITTQQGKDFPWRIQNGIGLNGNSRAVNLYDQYGDPHTSSLPLGFHKISEEGELNENDSILFVASGSGLTTACAMYTA